MVTAKIFQQDDSQPPTRKFVTAAVNTKSPAIDVPYFLFNTWLHKSAICVPAEHADNAETLKNIMTAPIKNFPLEIL